MPRTIISAPGNSPVHYTVGTSGSATRRVTGRVQSLSPVNALMINFSATEITSGKQCIGSFCHSTEWSLTTSLWGLNLFCLETKVSG